MSGDDPSGENPDADADAIPDADADAIPDADALAGIVDLFGALTRAELLDALEELQFKRGEPYDERAVSAAIDDAVEGYVLVEATITGATGDDASDASDRSTTEVLAPGPTAFPTLPSGAEDLPHILDIPERTLDRERLATDVFERIRADAARAVDEGDQERIARLLDLSYDLEAWGPVDAGAVRERLDATLEDA